MTRAELFRKNADECREQAGRSRNPLDKEHWLKIAEHWLADRAELLHEGMVEAREMTILRNLPGAARAAH